MKIIEKDILTVESGIICHQVNCQGVMGKGIAKQIKDKWPIVYTDYIKSISKLEENFGADLAPLRFLGEYQLVKISDKLSVCNIAGQLEYGYNARFTDYGALKSAFTGLCENLNHDQYWCDKSDIYFPNLMGCINGGGNWNIVNKLIEFHFPNAIICKLPEKKS